MNLASDFSARRAAALAACQVLIMTAHAFAADYSVRLMTLDPGHFHAALVQKSMYPQVDPVVHVFAPGGADLDLHLQRIEGFNSRTDDPTHWREVVYTGPDFAEKMLAEEPGNVVVLSGNNARKADYILRSVTAGLNVLADKPMVITPADYPLLEQAFDVARKKGVLLYDIMTERHEITTRLQRELSRMPALFGRLREGTPEEPAVTKESVHHYFKFVSGKPLIRPAWFFDVTQQGEGIVDVTTHLVDLIQWECFPGRVLKPADVKVLSARRWATSLTREQFKRVTGQDQYPDYLKGSVGSDGNLQVFCNGEFTYALRGIVCKVSVTWNYEAPPGGGDTHYSIMRGTKSSLVIRQGKEQGYQPTLYVEPGLLKGEELQAQVTAALARLAERFPGLAVKPGEHGLEIDIPASYKVGHEAHFAQVTEAYLDYLKQGALPDWEVPNMLVKYRTIMEAFKMSR